MGYSVKEERRRRAEYIAVAVMCVIVLAVGLLILVERGVL